jgi:glutamine amidotransferase
MGWNNVRYTRESLLGAPDIAGDRFYFVHSYCVVCANREDVVGEATYGEDFCAMLERGNVSGTQFHPEKSHKYGFRLLERFCRGRAA